MVGADDIGGREVEANRRRAAAFCCLAELCFDHEQHRGFRSVAREVAQYGHQPPRNNSRPPTEMGPGELARRIIRVLMQTPGVDMRNRIEFLSAS